MSRLLLFALIGRRQQVTTADGTISPSDPLWEVRAYPSRMSIFGDSWEAARDAMKQMIAQAMEYHGTPDGWYDKQFTKMQKDFEQRALFESVVGECSGKPKGISMSECSPALAANIHIAFAAEVREAESVLR